jgi:osmotically-inducible protein OsmY
MREYLHDEEQEPRKEKAEDYYAGYYWSNDPYESYDLPGRESDSELKSSILERLHLNCGDIPLNSIAVSVEDGIVILTGHVKTYKERRLVGQEAWRTCGVVKVLNELQVTLPETAGPSRVLQEVRFCVE